MESGRRRWGWAVRKPLAWFSLRQSRCPAGSGRRRWLRNGRCCPVEVAYLHGASGSGPLAQDVDLATQWLLSDRMGTIRDILSGSGQLQDHIRYDSYGRILARTDASVFNRYFFAGRPWESELGWYYNQARFYDPANGRFVSEDPSSFTAGEPNLYRYGVNDPINNVDPSGLSAVSALANPFQSAFNELRKQNADMRLQVEQSQTFMNFNVVTFGSGVANDFGKVAFPLGTALASALASAYFPPAAPVIALGVFAKSMYDLNKAAQEPGNEGLELWDGVKAGASAIASMGGFRVAFAVGTLLNTADVGVGIAYNDNDRLLGAVTGFLTDGVGYRTSARLDLKNHPSSSPTDFVGSLRQIGTDLGEARLTTLDGQARSFRSLPSESARVVKQFYNQQVLGLKSDLVSAQNYVRQVRQYRASAAASGAATDLVAVRLAVEPPEFKSSIFRKLNQIHRAIESGRTAWLGTLDQQIHEAAIRDVATRKSGNLKIEESKMGDTAYSRNARLRLQTEADLVTMVTDTNWIVGPSGGARSRSQRLEQAARAAWDELRGAGPTRTSLEANIREAGNNIIEYNMLRHTQYREQLIRMANEQLRLSRAQLDATAVSSLHEQTVALHASALMRVDNPVAPTPGAPFTHEMVKSKMPDMIRRLEMETIARKYPTIEGAQEAFRSLSDTSTQKSLATGRQRISNERQRDLLQNHIENLASGQEAMRRINREMHEMFPKGEGSIQSDLDHFRYAQSQALKTIIADKMYAFEGPWNHLVARLKDSADSFADILDLPFASHSQLKELADLQRAVNTGKIKIDGIESGDIVAIMLQGTAGSTISQIAHRANFVKDVYSGNFDRLHGTLRNAGEAWRTLADLTKSPMMEGSSDVDLGLVVKGGGEKLLSVFKSATQVDFPNGLSATLKGGAAIQQIVNFSEANPNSYIRKVANTKGLEVPVEWYVYQNRELAKIGSVSQLVASPIDRGGISVVPKGDSFDAVAHFSPFLDTYARSGVKSRVLAGGFLHSSYASIATTQVWVSAMDFAPVVEESLSRWKQVGLDVSQLTVHLNVENLPGTQLGYALIHNIDAEGRPNEVTIIVDQDAAGHGWYLDATPSLDEEFTVSSSGARIADSPAIQGKYDALSLLQHELGHLLGFTSSLDGFSGLVQVDEIGRNYIQVDEGRVWLDPTKNELDKLLHAQSLMSATLTPGVRKSASAIEAAIIEKALANSTIGFQQYLVEGHLHGDGIGFTPIQVALERQGVSATGLRNASLQQTNPASPDFGWALVGQANFASGAATIIEANGMLSDLSQSFVMPSGVQKLQFTLSGLQLEIGNATRSGDAFEVALLSGDDQRSRLGPIPGLAETDALLSLQADGRIQFAPQVSVDGVLNGQRIDMNQAIDVTIDISHLPPSSTSTLLFDLIGLGEDNSRVSVSNIRQFGALSWHNPTLAVDVNGDGKVTPLDALLIINELNLPKVSNDQRQLPPISGTVSPPPFFDVEENGLVTPLDALRVINYLNLASAWGSNGGGNNGGGNGLPSSWQNPVRPLDVSDDQSISPLDALLVINELNLPKISNGQGMLPSISENMKPAPYLDVNKDGWITPLDALLIVNDLNLHGTHGEGESGIPFSGMDSVIEDDLLDLIAKNR